MDISDATSPSKHVGEATSDRKTVFSQTLRRRIRSLELAPGSVVDEIALCEEFGLSRPPVRELMREMAAEGYIELESNRPARVSSMNYDSLRSFFLAAPLLYSATAQLAATQATARDIKTLNDIQTKYLHAIETHDVAERVHWNDRFHFEIGNIARNPHLLPSLLRVQIDHARLGTIFYRSQAAEDMVEDVKKSAHQHDQIINAIESGDAQRAGELARDHMDMARHRMTEYIVPEGVEVPLPD